MTPLALIAAIRLSDHSGLGVMGKYGSVWCEVEALGLVLGICGDLSIYLVWRILGEEVLHARCWSQFDSYHSNMDYLINLLFSCS